MTSRLTNEEFRTIRGELNASEQLVSVCSFISFLLFVVKGVLALVALLALTTLVTSFIVLLLFTSVFGVVLVLVSNRVTLLNVVPKKNESFSRSNSKDALSGMDSYGRDR